MSAVQVILQNDLINIFHRYNNNAFQWELFNIVRK
jgi:hypothetical protein